MADSNKQEDEGIIREDTTPDQASASNQQRKKKLILIGIISFLVLAGIIAAVVVLVVLKPKQPTGYHEYQEDLLAALRGKRSYLGDQPDDTPQAKALNWLKTDTGSLVDVTPPHVMVERFAMAVFYFATDGPNWEHKAGFLTQPSICEWWNSKDEYLLCHESDQVTDMNFCKSSPFRLFLFGNILKEE